MEGNEKQITSGGAVDISVKFTAGGFWGDKSFNTLLLGAMRKESLLVVIENKLLLGGGGGHWGGWGG